MCVTPSFLPVFAKKVLMLCILLDVLLYVCYIVYYLCIRNKNQY